MAEEFYPPPLGLPPIVPRGKICNTGRKDSPRPQWEGETRLNPGSALGLSCSPGAVQFPPHPSSFRPWLSALKRCLVIVSENQGWGYQCTHAPSHLLGPTQLTWLACPGPWAASRALYSPSDISTRKPVTPSRGCAPWISGSAMMGLDLAALWERGGRALCGKAYKVVGTAAGGKNLHSEHSKTKPLTC